MKIICSKKYSYFSCYFLSFSLFFLFIVSSTLGVKSASASFILEDFDGVAVGTRLYALDQGWSWKTPNDDNGIVSDTVSATSPNSAKVLSNQKVYKIFDDVGYWGGMGEINWPIPDLGEVQFKVRVDSLASGNAQFGLCRADGTPSTCVEGARFSYSWSSIGKFNFYYNNATEVDIGDVVANTWYTVKVGWDLPNSKIRYSFNGGSWSDWLTDTYNSTEIPNAFYIRGIDGANTYLDDLVFTDSEPPPVGYCATSTMFIAFGNTIGFYDYYYSALTARCFDNLDHCTIGFGVDRMPRLFAMEPEGENTYFDFFINDEKVGSTSLLREREYGRFTTIQAHVPTPTSSLSFMQMRIHDENLNNALCIPTSSTPVLTVALLLVKTSMATSTEWCDQAELCAGISTTTNAWSIQGLMNGFNCWVRQAICWTFMPTPESLGYLANSYDLASTRLPLSPFTTIWRNLNIMATGTQAIAPGHIAVPFWSSSSQSYIGSTTDLSPVNMGYGWTKFRRLETIAMWIFLSVVPTIACLIAIIV